MEIYYETVSDDVKRSGSMEEIRNTAQIYDETVSDDYYGTVFDDYYETVSDDVKRSGLIEEIRNTAQIYDETVSDDYYGTVYDDYYETVSDDVKRSGSMEEIRNTAQIYDETVSDDYYGTVYDDYDETVSDDVKRSGSMEEIRNAAQIYYETAPENVKRLVDYLFKKMDSNKDGKVSLNEFARFMREGEYVAMNNRTFFKKINKKKNEKLDFEDVKTLCYILASGRPLCDGCTEFIEGMYFTCVECFNKDQSFCLHPDCFRKKEYDHKQTHSHFEDNYKLLESIRNNRLPAQNKLSKRNKSKPRTSPPLEIVPIPSKPNQSTPSTSISAIVPRPRGRRSRKTPLRFAVDMAADVAVIAAALAQCTIM